MTQVQLTYDLERPLTDADSSAISNAHSWYGIKKVALTAAMDKIVVDFDASRLMEQDVEAVLIRFGVPIVRKWATP